MGRIIDPIVSKIQPLAPVKYLCLAASAVRFIYTCPATYAIASDTSLAAVRYVDASAEVELHRLQLQPAANAVRLAVRTTNPAASAVLRANPNRSTAISILREVLESNLAEISYLFVRFLAEK